MASPILPDPAPDAKIYVTAASAEAHAGISRWLIGKDVPPDAWTESADGTKSFPLWLKSSVEAYVAKRNAERNAQVS